MSAKLALKQLKEKVMAVVPPGKDREDFMTIIGWIEKKVDSYRDDEKAFGKNLRYWQKCSSEANQWREALKKQVGELEEEVEELSRKLETHERNN